MMLRTQTRLALVALSVLVACGAALAQGSVTGPLPRGMRITRLLVDKSDHTMSAYRGRELIKVYRVAVGVGGLGPKQWEGDARTPEGRYRIDSRHHSASFHRFLHVSYPNADDRRRYRGLRERGELPEDEDGDVVGIGGAIGIHGTPALVPRFMRNWTAGCIAVTDEEAEELYGAVADGAVIEIRE